MREPAVYIMASQRNGTLYPGVTADLARRPSNIAKPRSCKLLVWYERYDMIVDAIAREKQLEGGSRRKKLALIGALDPQWRD